MTGDIKERGSGFGPSVNRSKAHLGREDACEEEHNDVAFAVVRRKAREKEDFHDLWKIKSLRPWPNEARPS